MAFSRVVTVILFLFSFSPLNLPASNLPAKDSCSRLSELISFHERNSDGATPLFCISFNTWGLPVRLAGHEQSERFKMLPDSLLVKNADIICLQETFHPELRAGLISGLRAAYYMHQDYDCNIRQMGLVTKDCYGGLMTLSKYPVVSESFYRFPFEQGYSIIEKIGSKGFLFTTLNVNGNFINVINTHLYAGEDDKAENFRLKQIQFMFQVLKSRPEFEKYPTMLMGDINTTHPDVLAQTDRFAASEVYPFLTATECCFEDTAPVLNDEVYTYDGSKNHYIKDSANRQKLDYCFFRNSSSDHYLQHVTSDVLFSENQLLSDHFGWASRFSLINDESGKIKLIAHK